MNVAAYAVEAVPEPKSYIQHRQVLAMVLRSGSFEVGLRRSDMSKSSYATGEMILARRHVDEWVRTGDIHLLVLEISDTALRGDRDGTSGEVELHHKPRLVDARVSALLTAVNRHVLRADVRAVLHVRRQNDDVAFFDLLALLVHALPLEGRVLAYGADCRRCGLARPA